MMGCTQGYYATPQLLSWGADLSSVKVLNFPQLTFVFKSASAVRQTPREIDQRWAGISDGDDFDRGVLEILGKLTPLGSRWRRHSMEPPDSGRSCTSGLGR
jgi:hypothetical protein